MKPHIDAITETLAQRVVDLERRNRILEAKCAGSLANNLCPDCRDKQQGRPCLACMVQTLGRVLEQINDTIYAQGAPLGSREYFRIRELCCDYTPVDYNARMIRAVEANA
jgi:hypothetical protein